ncbi:hypothetical protein BZA77DRAFT_295213 [Pyronema omphalodes]|nr:hypothetical protein BZA77DRAFT_295710 [Pyronema omphalodes]KAI5814352.1 hypothetical protein BZA77DRAFT_295213 [Pyronema omphalodes]
MAPLSLINAQNTPATDIIPTFDTLLDQITPSAAASYTILREEFQVLVRSLIKRHNPFNNPAYDAHDGIKIHDMMMETRNLCPQSRNPKKQGNQTTDHEAHNDLPYRFMIAGFARLGNLVRSAYVGDTHSAAMHQIDKNTCSSTCLDGLQFGRGGGVLEGCRGEEGQEMNGGCGGDGGVL